MGFYQATEAASAAEDSSQLLWLEGKDDGCDLKYRNPSYDEVYLE